VEEAQKVLERITEEEEQEGISQQKDKGEDEEGVQDVCMDFTDIHTGGEGGGTEEEEPLMSGLEREVLLQGKGNGEDEEEKQSKNEDNELEESEEGNKDWGNRAEFEEEDKKEKEGNQEDKGDQMREDDEDEYEYQKKFK